MEINVRLAVQGKGIHLFYALYTERLGPELDKQNIRLAGELTKRAKANLKSDIKRPQEHGERPHARLTGTLTGPNSAIQGNAISLGTTPSGAGRFGKGVGWPNREILDRRARHWRRLEFGSGPFEMPRGVFLQGGTPQYPNARTRSDVFYTYSEYLRMRGLRRGSTFQGRLTQRQAAARQRAVGATFGGGRRRSFLVGGKGKMARGIEAKNFIGDAWNEIMGPKGEKYFKETDRVITEVFKRLRSG